MTLNPAITLAASKRLPCHYLRALVLSEPRYHGQKTPSWATLAGLEIEKGSEHGKNPAGAVGHAAVKVHDPDPVIPTPERFNPCRVFQFSKCREMPFGLTARARPVAAIAPVAPALFGYSKADEILGRRRVDCFE